MRDRLWILLTLGAGIFLTAQGHSHHEGFELWCGGWLMGLSVAEIIVDLTLRKSNVRSSK